MRVWFVKWTLWWLDNAKRVNFTFFSRIIVHKMRGCVEETVNFTGTGKVLTSITVCVQNRQHIVVRDLLVWINHSVSNLPPLERSAFNCRYITVRDTCVAGKCKGVRCHSYRCPRWLKLRHSILGPTGQRNTSILSRWQNWSPSIVNLPKRFDFSQLTLFFCRRCEPVILYRELFVEGIYWPKFLCTLVKSVMQTHEWFTRRCIGQGSSYIWARVWIEEIAVNESTLTIWGLPVREVQNFARFICRSFKAHPNTR